MSDPHHRSHAAHPRRGGEGEVEDLQCQQLPLFLLRPELDDVRELLEELDDAIFAALQGSEDSLHQVKKLWPRALAEISPELIEESREQYLRFAVEVSRRFERKEIRTPQHCIAALEIITLLTGE